jgi:anti-sigma regulatory factor (Ser/Thr protein kinase)
VTEIVGNSVRHSGLKRDEHVRITADWSRTSLRVVVRDRPRSLAQVSLAGTIRPGPGAESGWGLFIVDRLSSRWGRQRGWLLVRARWDSEP